MSWPGRCSGVLLHPTSLPGRWGAGDLGPEARRFLGWLESAGQRMWQFLPTTPAGAGGSPYSSPSAFAGNPMLISVDDLIEDGLLGDEPELAELEAADPASVDFALLYRCREPLVRRAAERLLDRGPGPSFAAFRAEHAPWLVAWREFAAEKRARGDAPWWDWAGAPLASERDRSIEDAIQFLYFEQVARLRAEARRRNVLLVGDLPIFVAQDSADVRSWPSIFLLDEQGQPEFVAGVPPDAFSELGQLWGNPLYDWDALAEQDYAWWRLRVRFLLKQVDLVRIDHFRGFAAAWAVPAHAEDARSGSWTPGPGRALFEALRDELGTDDLPFIAEDLGIITPDVEALRDGLELPGMRILQFAFDGNPQNPYLPQQHTERSVVYTGTHDNDTVRGWWHHAPEWSRDALRRHVQRDVQDADVADTVLGIALRSPAALCITPIQDVLGLDGSARMNLPGTPDGNWRWRLDGGQLTTASSERLAALTREAQR